MQSGAEELIEKNVPGTPIRLIHTFDTLFKLDLAAHTKLGRRSGSGSDVVRLHGTGNQDGVGTSGQSISKVELELPCLVASHPQTCAIVALDPHIRAA